METAQQRSIEAFMAKQNCGYAISDVYALAIKSETGKPLERTPFELSDPPELEPVSLPSRSFPQYNPNPAKCARNSPGHRVVTRFYFYRVFLIGRSVAIVTH